MGNVASSLTIICKILCICFVSDLTRRTKITALSGFILIFRVFLESLPFDYFFFGKRDSLDLKN